MWGYEQVYHASAASKQLGQNPSVSHRKKHPSYYVFVIFTDWMHFTFICSIYMNECYIELPIRKLPIQSKVFYLYNFQLCLYSYHNVNNPGTRGWSRLRHWTLAVNSRKNELKKNYLNLKKKIFLLVISKYWGNKFSATGVSLKGWKAESVEKKKKSRWKQWPDSFPSATTGGARKPPGPKVASFMPVMFVLLKCFLCFQFLFSGEMCRDKLTSEFMAD